MIETLKPYQVYKHSGVSWLGQVPGHWDVAACRHRYSQCLGKMLDAKRIRGTHLVSYLRNVDVQWDRINTSDLPMMDILPREYERYTLKPGDLLVCEGGDVGRCAIWRGGLGLCGFQKALHRLRPLSDGDVPRFLLYLLWTASRAGAFTDGHESTIAHLTGDKLRAHRFGFPPQSEQVAIVHFLATADRRINRYIRNRERLTALLSEQRDVIIDRAVFRGLNPHVRLTHSGAEWLREIPKHWEIRRNGRLFAQRNQTGFSNLPILEVSLRTGVRVRDFENSTRKQIMSDRAKYKRAAQGDIAYNMMRLWQGAVGVAPVDGLVSPAYIVARPLDGTEPRYFSYLFRTRAYMGEVERYSRGIVKDRNRLYWEDFKQMPSPCPPTEEQAQIADAIDQATRVLSGAIDRVRRAIDLILEFRGRLIADVLTGKVDVREAAANLQDQGEDEPGIGQTAEIEADEDADELAEEDVLEDA
jgi:type I restriction enzyme, S subunit